MDANVLIEIGFTLGAFAAILTRKERLGDSVTLDVCVERVARGERRVAQVTLQITNSAVRFHVILQGCFRFHLRYNTVIQNYHRIVQIVWN